MFAVHLCKRTLSPQSLLITDHNTLTQSISTVLDGSIISLALTCVPAMQCFLQQDYYSQQQQLSIASHTITCVHHFDGKVKGQTI